MKEFLSKENRDYLSFSFDSTIGDCSKTFLVRLSFSFSPSLALFVCSFEFSSHGRKSIDEHHFISKPKLGHSITPSGGDELSVFLWFDSTIKPSSTTSQRPRPTLGSSFDSSLDQSSSSEPFIRLGIFLRTLISAMHSINSSHRATGDIPSPMSLRESHFVNFHFLWPIIIRKRLVSLFTPSNTYSTISTVCRTRTNSSCCRPKLLTTLVSCSIQERKRLVSLLILLKIDQHCAVSIRLDGLYIPAELRQLLDHHRPLHLNVTTQDAFSFESQSSLERIIVQLNWLRQLDSVLAFKRCVTTFLSRERESDENNSIQGNWTIVDQGVVYSLISRCFDSYQFLFHFALVSNDDHHWLRFRWNQRIQCAQLHLWKSCSLSRFTINKHSIRFLFKAYFIRCLRQQYRCMVTVSCESPVVKLSSKLTVAITFVHCRSIVDWDEYFFYSTE